MTTSTAAAKNATAAAEVVVGEEVADAVFVLISGTGATKTRRTAYSAVAATTGWPTSCASKVTLQTNFLLVEICAFCATGDRDEIGRRLKLLLVFSMDRVQIL